MRKIGLIVLFNHNYEQNIPIIKELYKERFEQLKILMPFYYGDDPDVIGVYGNSFLFHTYIAQARTQLMQMDCDDFLIIGDDLLLNPSLNSHNIHEKLSIPLGAFYIDAVENVSRCLYNRPLLEASKFSPHMAGLDKTANRYVPDFDTAYKCLYDKNLIGATTLSCWRPFFPQFKKGFFKNISDNYGILKARIWHLLQMCKYKLRPVKMPYPYVFGYSDIVLIPRERMVDWCRYLEVFATWNMFVEMAIPTAMLLLPNAELCFAKQSSYKTGNVWYPQDPAHFSRISSLIDNLIGKCESPGDLLDNYPAEYLYLHPVKLSKFRKK
ncbi:MAG: hypothetical protein IKZ13_01135 [Akkermansia sp.]|nr:hypothetical protein [Akkermansia sp.]